MSKEFKVGDKVYCPFQTTKVLTAREWNNPEFPILVGEHVFTRNGKRLRNDSLPSIFHATPRMQAKLEDTYGVEFEKPPVKATSKEIVKAYLDRGDKNVCCWVSDFVETPTSVNEWVYISDYMDDSHPFTTPSGCGWKFATPFDPRTEEPITELPE